jgi:class 3 adenylate cyclase
MTPARGEGDRPGDRAAVLRTFLIADIRGYTRFTQERGDEAAAQLATKFAEVVHEGVEAHDGELVELRGDEALAVFASARRAIRAAVELQRSSTSRSTKTPCSRLAWAWAWMPGKRCPWVRATGGGILNLAARLCALARPGEVLASQTVVHLARSLEGIRFEPLEPLQLKGIHEPVQAVSVVVDGPVPAVRPSPPKRRAELPPELDPVTPLVGRRRELRWLRWGWRQARRGDGRVLFVTGPSGIGRPGSRPSWPERCTSRAGRWPTPGARGRPRSTMLTPTIVDEGQ